ncbi:MAG: VWA domain-containing protein [Polyangiaceae bacterium]|nr:VWA domain-containing protein [Polyangiaceae bacterium]
MPHARANFALLLAAMVGFTAGCSGDGSRDPSIGGTGGGSFTEDTAAGAGAGEGTGGGGGGTPDANSDDSLASRAGGDPAATGGENNGGQFSLPDCASNAPMLAFYFSADDSNSMASPAIAREELNAKRAPDGTRIRTHEFLNYYNVHYPLKDPNDPTLGVFWEMHPHPSAEGSAEVRYRLQIGVQAPKANRESMVLTFVVDASGSLVGPGIERARAAILSVADQLQPGDVINVVKWATEDSVLLKSYSATGTQADKLKLAEVVSKLSPGGGSDLHSGLLKGYELAAEKFDKTKINRVVLISDGGANIGVLDRDIIAAAAEKAEGEGIYMAGIGVGPAQGYSDNLMDLVTDAGRGAYVYVDSNEEAQSLFKTRFEEIMMVAARNVQVQIDLPSYLEIEKFYGEKYSSDPAKIEPQNLAPNDSMVFNEILVLKNPPAACGQDTITVKVTWETPISHEPKENSVPPISLFDLMSTETSPQMARGNAIITYAEALKLGDTLTLQNAVKELGDAAATAGNADLTDLASLLQQHPNWKP